MFVKFMKLSIIKWAIWKSRHQHLGISNGISIGINIDNYILALQNVS